MLSLMGPNDLQLWLDGKYLCGKDWSRGFITNTHTFENPLELWKYYQRDTDGVAGSDLLNAPAAVLTPGRFDTSLANRKQMPDTMPFTATHHGLTVERRSVRDDTAADDLILSIDNLLELEARCWYELYFNGEASPADEGLATEFPPGFGPEGDFTDTDQRILRTGMNNYSVVKMLPKPRTVNAQLLAKVIPVHGPTTFTITGGGQVGGVGLRNMVYWFK